MLGETLDHEPTSWIIFLDCAFINHADAIKDGYVIPLDFFLHHNDKRESLSVVVNKFLAQDVKLAEGQVTITIHNQRISKKLRFVPSVRDWVTMLGEGI